MKSCLTDRQACDGWRQVCLMKHGKSQIPVNPLIQPTEGRLCCWKVPQSGSEEEPVFPQVKGKLASRGNNVYVLDFKHFLPVRKSRCKGVFFCLKDLTDFFFLFCFFSCSVFFLVSQWRSDGVWVSIISTTHRGCLSWICIQVATECAAWHSLKICVFAKCVCSQPQTPLSLCGGI